MIPLFPYPFSATLPPLRALPLRFLRALHATICGILCSGTHPDSKPVPVLVIPEGADAPVFFVASLTGWLLPVIFLTEEKLDKLALLYTETSLTGPQ